MEPYIRQIETRDRDSFLGFLGRWITRIPVLSHYRWLYQQNPHGQALTWLAIHPSSDRIIGCTSVFPRRVWLRDHITSGCVGGDTFVDPDYRRQGIAGRLHDASLRDMREAGIGFHYGFPLSANLGAFLKIGGYHPGDFRPLRLLLRSRPVVRKLRLGKGLSSGLARFCDPLLSFYVRLRLSKGPPPMGDFNRIERFDARFDRLAEEVMPSFGICGVRDCAYLNWRYFENPRKTHIVLAYEDKGMLHGFVVLEFFQGRCIVFDLFVRNEDELVANLIRSLTEYAMSAGSDLVVFAINPSGPYSKNFCRCGFRFGYGARRNPLMVLTAPDEPEAAYLKNMENWYLTYGDEDMESMGGQ